MTTRSVVALPQPSAKVRTGNVAQNGRQITALASANSAWSPSPIGGSRQAHSRLEFPRVRTAERLRNVRCTPSQPILITVISAGEIAVIFDSNAIAREFLNRYRVLRLTPEIALAAADVDRELIDEGGRLGRERQLDCRLLPLLRPTCCQSRHRLRPRARFTPAQLLDFDPGRGGLAAWCG